MLVATTFVFMKLIVKCTLLALLMALNACKKDNQDAGLVLPADETVFPSPDSLDLGELRSVDVVGIVRDEDGNPIAGALVNGGWSSQQTVSDERGLFLFDGLVCYEKSAYVRITKTGFFEGSRTWIPTDNGNNRVVVELLSNAAVGSFSASNGGSVQFETFTLNFPPNVIEQENGFYAGLVQVAINAIDATSALDVSMEMPGTLTGRHNSDWMVLRSFGMAAIELRSESGELLRLAPNTSVEMRCTIPSEMQGMAPSSIPLWSFNEATSFWQYEGDAVRIGNEYVGQVTHFSFWNFDVETLGVNYTVTVNYSELPIGFYPLDNALLMLTGSTVGTIAGTTGSNGQITGLVPLNESMVLQVLLPCAGGFQEVYSATVGPFAADISQVVEINALPYLATIQGTLQDCDGSPSNGYVWLNDNDVVLVQSGAFQLTTCTGTNSLRAYCVNNGSAGNGFLTDVNVSSGVSALTVVCEDCFPIGAPGGGVSDVDGNNYPTVINGNQEWMASNLNVSHFSNGDSIAEVPNDALWASTTLPAWCYWNNNPGNSVIFGKLYNGFAAEDSRNICPTGWHVPTNTEWETLITTLGGASVAASAMRTTGTIADGNGFWPFDNVVSNNVSGFSAQPAGFRNLDGTFPTQIYGTVWWTSSLTVNDTYFTRGVYSFSNSVFNQDLNRPQGLSVRCLHD